jgi:hypothetical protein
MVADAVAEAVGRERRVDPVLPRTGGPAGNALLTAWTALVLLVCSLAELLTLFDVKGLISWHVAIGALLVPPAVLKTASTGWRIARYYVWQRLVQSGGTASCPAAAARAARRGLDSRLTRIWCAARATRAGAFTRSSRRCRGVPNRLGDRPSRFLRRMGSGDWPASPGPIHPSPANHAGCRRRQRSWRVVTLAAAGRHDRLGGRARRGVGSRGQQLGGLPSIRRRAWARLGGSRLARPGSVASSRQESAVRGSAGLAQDREVQRGRGRCAWMSRSASETGAGPSSGAWCCRR